MALCDTQHAGKETVTRPKSDSILQMTLSVTIYFPAHCGHTGSPDWGDVTQGRLWVDSRPRRLRLCGPVRSCDPVFCSDRSQGAQVWITCKVQTTPCCLYRVSIHQTAPPLTCDDMHLQCSFLIRSPVRLLSTDRDRRRATCVVNRVRPSVPVVNTHRPFR